MKTEKILLAVTILAAVALTRFRLVNYAGAQAIATDRALGVANTDYAQGEHAGVNARGELLVEAGAAITAGAQVQPDASGRAITLAAGVAFGTARDSAAAAGDIIRVLV